MAESLTTSRRSFLGQIGKTLAVGVGLAAVGISSAHAATDVNVQCCPSSCGTSCSGNKTHYFCGAPASCCIGCRTNTGCFTGPCCPC
jgi:hypothetical protein